MKKVSPSSVIQLISGVTINIFAPDPDAIFIEDIAHRLSHLSRYTDQSKQFYSLAQHSVLAAQQASQPDKMAALLHNAAEAYLSALSQTCRHDNYNQLETSLMWTISEKYNFTYPFSSQISIINESLLKREFNELVICSHFNHFAEYTPDMAKKAFLDYFEYLQAFQ